METKNLLTICIAVILVVVVLSGIMVVTNVNNSHSDTNINKEDMECQHSDDFLYDDSDNDGYLTFEEVFGYLAHTPEDAAKEMFEQADSNNNGLLKGAEFDDWLSLVSNSSYAKEYAEAMKKNDESSNTDSSSDTGGESYYELAFGHDYMDDSEHCTGSISLSDGKLKTTSAELISCLYKSSSNTLLIQANYNSHRETNYIKLVKVYYLNSDSELYYPPSSTTTSFTIHLEDDTPTSCVVWYEGSGHVDMPY